VPFTTITISGTFETPGAHPAQGTVVATLSAY